MTSFALGSRGRARGPRASEFCPWRCVFVVADEHERGHTDLFQAVRVIMLLARQYKMKIVLQGRDARHPDLEKFFDQIGMSCDEFFGPTCFNGVLTNVVLEAHAEPCRGTWREECPSLPDEKSRWRQE